MGHCPNLPSTLRLSHPLLVSTFCVLPAWGQIEYPEPVPSPPLVEEADQEPSPEGRVVEGKPVLPSHWEGQEGRVVSVWIEFEKEKNISEELTRKYLARLRDFGLAAPRETGLHALSSLHMPSIELGARLLESVGEAGDASVLVDTAGSVGDLKVASYCLESALRLGEGSLPPQAIRLLSHPRKSLRPGVESRLARKATPSHLPELLRLLEFGRDGDSRLRAARLLANFSEEPLTRSLLQQALRDRSVSVAFEALSILTGISEDRASSGDLATLEALLKQSDGGLELGYFLFALLSMQRESRELLIGPHHLPYLREGMASGDLFVSGAAAACLAEYEFRGGTTIASGIPDVEILHRLIRSVAGSSFYPQFARFAQLAERSLIRFSGVDLSQEGRAAWISWLEENHQGFRGVRAAISLNPSNLSALSFRWTKEGESRVLLGIDAEPFSHEGDDTRWIGPMDLRRLHSLLDRTGIFGRDVIPGNHGSRESALRLKMELQAGPLRKPLSYFGPSQPSWAPGLLLSLDDLFDSLEWQRLGPEESRSQFVLERLPTWDSSTELESLQFKLGITLDRLSATEDELLLQWCNHLSSQRGIDGLWSSELAQRCLSEFPLRQHHPKLMAALLGLATRGASHQLLPDFLTAAIELSEPLRSNLLLQGLYEFGPQLSKTCLSDSRLVVRVAGARALGKAGPLGRDALLGALEDSNALVVRMAIRSLGELGDKEVVTQILPFAEPDQIRSVRREAIQALGVLGDSRAFQAVSAAALPGEESSLRLDAVRALAQLPGDEVDQAFALLFPDFAGGILERDFALALGKRGISSSVIVYSKHLGHESSLVATRAAILAGRLGIPLAAEPLMGFLSANPRDPEILHALATCTTVDFRNMPDPAGVWAAWWMKHSQENGLEWLVSSAANYGFSLPKPKPEGEPSKEFLSELLRLLQKGPRHLRPSTAFHLFLLTNRDLPSVARESTDEQLDAIVSEWEIWLANLLD